MRELLTPRQVAHAIRVSESSVKRWCDKGVIPTRYTAGGHRRIPLNGLLEFLRASQHELHDPTWLGLLGAPTVGRRTLASATADFARGLLALDESRCRQIAVELFLTRLRISAICDDVLAPALAHIGHEWACGAVEVYQERLACEITHRVLNDLRAMVAEPDASAPHAIGGCPSGDFFSLGTAMAELVLRDAGWRSVSLGTNLPFDTLASAARQRQPRLLWLSCSHPLDEAELERGYALLAQSLGTDVLLVVGGQAMTPRLRERLPRASYGASMRGLESLAQSHFTLVNSPEVPTVP